MKPRFSWKNSEIRITCDSTYEEIVQFTRTRLDFLQKRLQTQKIQKIGESPAKNSFNKIRVCVTVYLFSESLDHG